VPTEVPPARLPQSWRFVRARHAGHGGRAPRTLTRRGADLLILQIDLPELHDDVQDRGQHRQKERDLNGGLTPLAARPRPRHRSNRFVAVAFKSKTCASWPRKLNVRGWSMVTVTVPGYDQATPGGTASRRT